MDALVEIIGALIITMLTGLGIYTKRAHARIDELNAEVRLLQEKKSNHSDILVIQQDIKAILEELKRIEVETIRWQSRAEGQGLNKRG